MKETVQEIINVAEREIIRQLQNVYDETGLVPNICSTDFDDISEQFVSITVKFRRHGESFIVFGK